MDPVDGIGVAESIMLVALCHCISDDDLLPVDIIRVEQQVVGMRVALQNGTEKIGEQVFLRHQREKSGIKSAFPYHDGKYKRLVVLNDHVMLRRRGDDAEFSGFQEPVFVFKSQMAFPGGYKINLKIIVRMFVRPRVAGMPDDKYIPCHGDDIRL